MIATILRETGKDTGSIQTFEQLRKAVWDAVGFTALKRWVDKQNKPERLINSSERRWLFDEMKVLGNAAFGANAIFCDALEESKSRVMRLYGWLSLVKIFWNITDKKPRFSDLATIKDDCLYWEENITCCTLIFQIVLATEKLFFSLDEVARFCKLSRGPEWTKTMKQSFRQMAEQNNAVSAIPIFEEYIEHLAEEGTNIYRIGHEVHLSKKEKLLVAAVREIAQEYLQVYVLSTENKKKTKKELKEETIFLFSFACARVGIQEYLKEAEDYLSSLIEEVSTPSDLTDLPPDLLKHTEGE